MLVGDLLIVFVPICSAVVDLDIFMFSAEVALVFQAFLESCIFNQARGYVPSFICQGRAPREDELSVAKHPVDDERLSHAEAGLL